MFEKNHKIKEKFSKLKNKITKLQKITILNKNPKMKKTSKQNAFENFWKINKKIQRI